MEYLLACLLFVAVLTAVRPANAEGRPSYTIYRAGTPISVDGRLDEPAWVAAPDVGAFVFPWYSDGRRPHTRSRGTGRWTTSRGGSGTVSPGCRC